MYTAAYMASKRTQLYLTEEQRRRLDEMGGRKSKKMAEMVREAVDSYLAASGTDFETALRASFGTMPDLDVPSRDEWDRKRKS
jgi:predicted DNA-binding protein